MVHMERMLTFAEAWEQMRNGRRIARRDWSQIRALPHDPAGDFPVPWRPTAYVCYQPVNQKGAPDWARGIPMIEYPTSGPQHLSSIPVEDVDAIDWYVVA